MHFSELLKQDKIEEVTAITFLETWERLNRSIGHLAYVMGSNDDNRLWECLGEEPEFVLNHSGGCEGWLEIGNIRKLNRTFGSIWSMGMGFLTNFLCIH
jgi:hypothetical protein